MSIMSPVLQNKNNSAEIALIAFSIFVHLNDVEKNISAQEVKRFQALLNEPGWTDNEDLRDGLIELKEHYSSFWIKYEDHTISVDPRSIAATLDTVQRHLGDLRTGQLKDALSRFLSLLDRGSFGVRQKDNPLRASAKGELASILIGSKGASDLPRSKPPQRPEKREATGEAKSVSPPSDAATAPIESTAQPSSSAVQPLQSTGQNSIWSGRSKLYCVSVVNETHDVKTYEFVAEPGTRFQYQPGQAITVEVPVQGLVLRRTYTISSSPSRPYLLAITVKRMPLGWMSNWLFDNMIPGRSCMAHGPFGRFSCVNHPAQKLFFLAAGSGMTPIMSMLRWLADTASETDVILINNVRTPADIIFQQELLHLTVRMGSRLKLFIIPSTSIPGVPWHGRTGRLSESLLRAYLDDLPEREVFVCGPTGYMRTAKSMLTLMGLTPERYHEETFGTSVSSPPSRLAPTETVREVSPPAKMSVGLQALTVRPALAQPSSPLPAAVSRSSSPKTSDATAPQTLPAVLAIAQSSAVTPKEKVTDQRNGQVMIVGGSEPFSFRKGQTILEAAQEAGADIASSCGAGNCGTCRMRIVSGKVEMGSESCLSAEEIAAGYVLTCVGRPSGSVVLSS